MKNLPLIKRGSVKNLRGPLPGKNEIVFEFTDDFSVFDWGKMPDAIPGKGAALLALAAHLFRELSHPSSWRGFFKSSDGAEMFRTLPRKFSDLAPNLRRELESVGMRSCFRGLYPSAKKPEGLLVERLELLPPAEVRESSGAIRFDYSQVGLKTPGALIPLEVVFRHGLTDKSSFFERNPGTSLKPGHVFATPLIEFFTKLEPTDRFIPTESEIFTVGRIDSATLLELELRSVFLSVWLKRECALRDLELIDGKFEWGLDRESRIMLADAIGPDELRLVEKRRGFHVDPANPTKPARLSKEFLREYYRGSAWFQELTELKKGGDLEPGWQHTVQAPVPLLPQEAVDRAVALYRSLERRFRPQTVLLFGAGAREHAIARKLFESPNLRTLIWAPGQDAAFSSLETQMTAGHFPNFSARLIRWTEGYSESNAPLHIERAKEAGVDLVIFSQDADLAGGAADRFREAGLSVFGPSREAARVEWSKQFTKELCQSAGVVTAKSHFARSAVDAERILRDLPWGPEQRYVVKADGLAAGKGVVVADTQEEALASLTALAPFGNSFVIEERLHGEESSWFAFSDGESFSILDSAKDYKRLREGQTGPNTGGMGAVSPAPDATAEIRERVRTEVFAPIFSELRRRGLRYQGVLYAGLMTDPGGKLALIEFNARFGDPETQALLPRMETDLIEWLSACADGALIDYPRDVPFRNETAVYVVVAAPGYPEKPELGGAVALKPAAIGGDFLRFAGLKSKGENWEISGGRVLGALGLADSVEAARSLAYGHLEEAFAGGFFSGAQLRKDIGR